MLVLVFFLFSVDVHWCRSLKPLLLTSVMSLCFSTLLSVLNINHQTQQPLLEAKTRNINLWHNVWPWARLFLVTGPKILLSPTFVTTKKKSWRENITLSMVLSCRVGSNVNLGMTFKSWFFWDGRQSSGCSETWLMLNDTLTCPVLQVSESQDTCLSGTGRAADTDWV